MTQRPTPSSPTKPENPGSRQEGGLSEYRSEADLPDEVRRLVKLCQHEMGALEVWLFGSRARGDFYINSDFDLLAIVPDDASADADGPVAAFRLRRKSGAHADLFTVRMSDFLAARSTPNTLSYAVAQEGVRLDDGRS